MTPFLLCALISAVSALVSLGFFHSSGANSDGRNPHNGSLRVCQEPRALRSEHGCRLCQDRSDGSSPWLGA